MSDASYPLGESARGAVHAKSGLPVSDLTLDRVVAGDVVDDDLRVAPATLELQATFAEAGGNPQLAENLRRGAELISFGDDEVLRFYDMLRPGRSTAAELEELARTLDGRGAVRCAALVREAAAAYVRRGLIS